MTDFVIFIFVITQYERYCRTVHPPVTISQAHESCLLEALVSLDSYDDMYPHTYNPSDGRGS